MNRENILKNVLNVFITCRIKTFPIDCFDLLDAMAIRWSYQKIKLREGTRCVMNILMNLSATERIGL